MRTAPHFLAIAFGVSKNTRLIESATLFINGKTAVLTHLPLTFDRRIFQMPIFQIQAISTMHK
jgi:hypothetical protein